MTRSLHPQLVRAGGSGRGSLISHPCLFLYACYTWKGRKRRSRGGHVQNRCCTDYKPKAEWRIAMAGIVYFKSSLLHSPFLTLSIMEKEWDGAFPDPGISYHCVVINGCGDSNTAKKCLFTKEKRWRRKHEPCNDAPAEIQSCIPMQYVYATYRHCIVDMHEHYMPHFVGFHCRAVVMDYIGLCRCKQITDCLTCANVKNLCWMYSKDVILQ